MQIIAKANNIRISPEKIRLVVAEIKKMSPKEAVDMLGFVNKSTSPVLKKVINSAVANAKNNFGLDENSLTFKEIQITKGTTYKRWRPVSRGRAHSIFKRTSHIRIVLEGQEVKKAQEPKQIENKEVKNDKVQEKQNVKKEQK